MHHLIGLKTTARPLLMTLTLLCLEPLPQAQAVSPAPDGGYPGFTTAEGDNALFSLTSGAGNTAVGWFSLKSVTTGSFNTGVGAGTLVLNTGDSNTATGAAALLLNTTGAQNTANGTATLVSNSTGFDNTAVGFQALNSNTTGTGNTATGDQSLFFNTTGSGNTATGDSALSNNTTGTFNIALGDGAGAGVNTASGVICIGARGADLSNSCYVGEIFGQPVDPATAVPVFVDTNGKLGTAFSSRRFKHDIKPMDKASESLLALKPVTFHYKSDTKDTPQFGLIAEDVAAVNPDLVVRDKNGDVYTVRYDQVNAMLLNEFLKEHRKVEEQQATITQLKSTVARQQKDFEAAVAELKGQIQKVSAQLELNKPAPQTVLNDQ
jgi:hypothetical protein